MGLLNIFVYKTIIYELDKDRTSCLLIFKWSTNNPHTHSTINYKLKIDKYQVFRKLKIKSFKEKKSYTAQALAKENAEGRKEESEKDLKAPRRIVRTHFLSLDLKSKPLFLFYGVDFLDWGW